MARGGATVFFNLTADPAADAHSLTMAMQLAGHALDAGRRVVLFCNVRAVGVPTKGFDAELAHHDKPIKQLLAGLILRGAQVHVCPHCMEAEGVKEEELVAGARVTTRETLFAELGPATVVFTY
jgi:predicted peroxiredoxin